MAKGWKDIENRPKPLPKAIAIDLPIRIYLHASKNEHGLASSDFSFIKDNLSAEQWDEFSQVDWRKLRGRIIGEITITKQMRKRTYVEADHIDIGSQQKLLEILQANNDPAMSVWFVGEFGYVVEGGILYTEPLPCRGKLGFFEPDIDSPK